MVFFKSRVFPHFDLLCTLVTLGAPTPGHHVVYSVEFLAGQHGEGGGGEEVRANKL